MYVVKGEPREGYGAVAVTKRTREDALATAIDFLDQGISSTTPDQKPGSRGARAL